MTRDAVLALLREIAAGGATPEAAVERLATAPFEAVGDFATLDVHRALRQVLPEVVYGAGKTAEQCVAIAERLARTGSGVLVTRADDATQAALATRFPIAIVNPVGRTVRLPGLAPRASSTGPACVVTAGTSDLPVAEECAETLAACGISATRLTDVGVAGVHRLLVRVDELRKAEVVIVIAGMDGALPSVVGGLVAAPVIAVPTSVGYGAAFGGVSALLTMLTSCASGVTVVNIDNGFGAAAAAARILLAPTSRST